MEREIFEISDSELNELNSKFPPGKGSGLIGARSTEIIKLYFRSKSATCQFSEPRNGADLEVRFPDSISLLLEIKGTEDSTIAWQKLKVSSEQSYRMLVEEGIPIYRVTNVFSKTVEIYILKYDEDFLLEREPRWSIKRKLTKKNSPKLKPVKKSERNSANGSASKYSSLRRYLESQSGDEVTLLFSQAERILGFPLPKSASQYQAYWANQSDTRIRPWARAWQEAGFHVVSYKLSDDDGWVTFRRGLK